MILARGREEKSRNPREDFRLERSLGYEMIGIKGQCSRDAMQLGEIANPSRSPFYVTQFRLHVNRNSDRCV